VIDPLLGCFDIPVLKRHAVNRLVEEIGSKEIQEPKEDKMRQSHHEKHL
jgi:hypothetical protein